MTLFVVLSLLVVFIGVLVAVALGVRSMRAQERAGDDAWGPQKTDTEFGHPDEPGEPQRRRRQGTRRASGRTQPDGHDGRRGYSGRGSRAARPRESDPSYDTDPGIGTEYQRANGRVARTGRGAEKGYGDGYARRPVPAAAPGGKMAGDAGDPRVPAQAGRRRMKEQPKQRARLPRGPEGWNDTNWDRVSDEDYWAELSSDKPLASRTAQSAADLRSPDPEPKEARDARTDPNLMQPEPQTAAMAMPEFSASGLPGGPDRAELKVPALPVRRSGSTPDAGREVPAASRPAGHAAADYTDPNLALLASLGEPAVEGQPTHAAGGGRRSAPGVSPATPPGGWAAGGPSQGDWSHRGQEYAVAAGNPAGYYSAPPSTSGTYGSPSRGTQQQSGGYATSTPGYGIPATTGYAARNSYDTGPITPAPAGLPAASYNAASYNAASYNAASYDTASHDAAAYDAAAYGGAYGAGLDQTAATYGGAYGAGRGAYGAGLDQTAATYGRQRRA